MVTASASADCHDDASHFGRTCVKWLTVGTALAAGAVIIAPYVLPALGMGGGEDIGTIMSALHNNPAVAGEGLAGFINKGLGAIPLIGETIAEGSLKTALISGALGAGGMILNRYLGKRDNGSHYVKWGKVLATSAMVASALIALPTVLTGITAGLTFLASAVDNGLASEALTVLRKTIGYANSESLASASLSGASLAVPHLLTCGAGAVPAILSFGLKHAGDDHTKSHTPSQNALPPLAQGIPPAPTVQAEVTVDTPTSAYRETRGLLTLTGPDGTPLTPQALKAVHTKKLHFFIIDSSLKDYHHLHPTPTEVPGQYSFTFTPKTSNPYSGWSDVTLLQDQKNYRIKTEIPSLLHRNIPASITPNSGATALDSGMTFAWQADKPLTKGASSQISVTIRDRDGNPVTDLEPVLGAFAHMTGFSGDGRTLIHTHPMGAEPGQPSDRSGPTLRFHVKPEVSGNTQFYLQVKRQGQEVTAPFGQYIRPPEKATERTEPRGQFARNPLYAQTSAGIA